MNRKRWLALALVVPVFTGFVAEAVPGEGLSPAERERYEQLRSTSTSEWKNVDLAEYLSLRTKDGSRLHSLAEAVALMRGTPMHPNAVTDDMRTATATSVLFRAVGLTYAENWEEYAAIVSMMAFKDGDVRMKNRIHWTAAEWPDAAREFVEDVTTTFATDVKRGRYILDRKDWTRRLFGRKEIGEFNESQDYFEERGTTYIPTSEWATLVSRLIEGDILFLLKGAETDLKDISILFMGPNNQMWFTKGRVVLDSAGVREAYCRMQVGVKVFRMKPDADQRLRSKARTVLARLVKVSPGQVDRWNENPSEKAARKWFGQPARVLYPNWVQRPSPDSTETVNGVTYGVYTVKPREWLYTLFGPDWKEIYNAPYNEEFRSQYESKSPGARIRWVISGSPEK